MHGGFFHILIVSVSFLNVFKSLLYSSFSCFGRVTPRYWVYVWFCYYAIVEVIVLMISFSISLSFVDSKATHFFCELILYPANLLKVLMSYRSFLMEFLGSMMCTILSSSNKDTSIFFFSLYLLCLLQFSYCCS